LRINFVLLRTGFLAEIQFEAAFFLIGDTMRIFKKELKKYVTLEVFIRQNKERKKT